MILSAHPLEYSGFLFRRNYGVLLLRRGQRRRALLLGKTEDLDRSLRELKCLDLTIRFYRTVETNSPSACERYIHQVYQSRQLVAPAGQLWFALDFEEIDHAINLWERKLRMRFDALRVVQALKEERSSDPALRPTDEDLSRCRRLRIINDQLEALSFEKECLELEWKLRIGTSAGVAGLASWESKSSRRFDSATLREVHPDLYEQFRRPTTTRYFRLLKPEQNPY